MLALDPSRDLGPLPRVDLDGFLRRFRARRIHAPAIVTGVSDGWPARAWTHAHVLGALGLPPRLEDGIGRAIPDALLGEVRWPALGVTRQRNVWIAPDGYTSHLHFDLPHNLNSVLRGEKEVVLFAPRETRRLYPHSAFQREVYPANSRVDLDALDVARFPRVRRARFRRAVVVAGETLYIPPRWWHFVRSRGESVAVNVWFDRDDETLRERLAKKPPRLVIHDLLARLRL